MRDGQVIILNIIIILNIKNYVNNRCEDLLPGICICDSHVALIVKELYKLGVL